MTSGPIGRLLAVELNPGNECVYSQKMNSVSSVCPHRTPMRLDRSFGDATERAVAINRDATRVVTVSADKIRLWNFESAKLIAEVSTYTDDIKNVHLDKDGNLLLVQRDKAGAGPLGGDAIKVDFIDLKNRQTTPLPKRLVDNFKMMAFSEDADTYAILTNRSIFLCRPP